MPDSKVLASSRALAGTDHAADQAEPLRLEGFLPYRLNLLATEVSQSLAHVYGTRFGISVPEWRILATLGQFGVMTARDIGMHSRMHKTTVSRAVAGLEKRGMILRRANREDMREAFLELSDTGGRVYREIVPMALAFSEALCQGLDAEERALLDRLLDRLSERIGHIAPTV